MNKRWSEDVAPRASDQEICTGTMDSVPPVDISLKEAAILVPATSHSLDDAIVSFDSDSHRTDEARLHALSQWKSRLRTRQSFQVSDYLSPGLDDPIPRAARKSGGTSRKSNQEQRVTGLDSHSESEPPACVDPIDIMKRSTPCNGVALAHKARSPVDALMVDISTPQGSNSPVEFTFAAPLPTVPPTDTHQKYLRPPAYFFVDVGINPATSPFESYMDHVSSPSSLSSPPVTTDIVVPLGLPCDGYPHDLPKSPTPP